MSVSSDMRAEYLRDVAATFAKYKALADESLSRVDDLQFFAALDDESNSLAVIVKHMAGNLRSRWTEMFTTDGEKPDRNRDEEFEITPEDTRGVLMQSWEDGWEGTLSVLESLTPDDFERSIIIRGETNTLVQALNRQLTHAAYHVGQIVFLAKHFRSDSWDSLSIPRRRR